MASKVLTIYKQKVESFELQPSGGGCFELTVDGKLVYSKLTEGRFPDDELLIKDLAKLANK
ncbi:MAG: Rdx family protein [Planctomycetales bacterium]|nr:Rdx family protein [Planctomycetales bacterium]